MDIHTLLQSTISAGFLEARNHNWADNHKAPEYTFTEKKFGSLYWNNLVAAYRGDIIEFSVVIGAVTEVYKSAHRIAIALRSEDFKEYTATELENLIKSKDMAYTEFEKGKLVNAILKNREVVPLEGYTIVQKSSTERKFIVIPNNIPTDTEIWTRCTCFTGDTQVILSNGDKKTFRELEGMENFGIIAFNKENGRFEKTNAIKCEKKKENADILEIILDNGKIIKSTPEHRFLLKSGEWIKAENLKEGMSLKALYYDRENNDILHEKGKPTKLRNHSSFEDYYTYIYLDPRKAGNFSYGELSFNYEPFYVGKGRGTRAYVCTEHNRSSYFMNKINKMRRDGFEPIVVVQNYGLTETAALDLEEKITRSIGIQKDKTGPLVNFMHGGGCSFGLEQSEEQKEKMRTNNPMFDKKVVEKAQNTARKRGTLEKVSGRMKENNPMHNPEYVKKSVETSREKGLFESKRMKDIAGKRTPQDYVQMVETRIKNNPDIYENVYIKNISKAHEKTRSLVEKGIFHKQMPEYREKQGISSKINAKNLAIQYISEIIHKYGEFKEDYYVDRRPLLKLSTLKSTGVLEEYVENAKNLLNEIQEYKYCTRPYLYDEFPNNFKFTKQQRRSLRYTIENITEHIKKYGGFKEDLYVNDYVRGEWSLDYLKNYGILKYIIEFCTSIAFYNHKIVSINQIENEDVYCLTSEHLGNFLVDCSDSNSEIISGVVVENCSDYYFSWSWYNADHKCLIGRRPPPYQRKYTDGKGYYRTLRNPHRLPGMCKHLLLFLALLMKGGLIEKLPTLTDPAPDLQGDKLNIVSRRDLTDMLTGLKDEIIDSGQGRGFY